MMTKEEGQAMVEFALVIPIFLMLVFFIIEVAWIGYQKTVFTYTTRNVAWELRLPNYEEWVMQTGESFILDPQESAQELKNNFILESRKKNTLMDLTKIKLYNSSIAIYGGRKSNLYKNHKNEAEGFQMKTSTMEISTSMDYQVTLLTPIGRKLFKDGFHLKKDIYKVRRGGQKSEYY